MEPGQKPAVSDGSPAGAQGADYNDDEGHASDLASTGAIFQRDWYPTLGTDLRRRSRRPNLLSQVVEIRNC